MKEQIKKILEAIGEDPDRPGLKHTPMRVEKSFQFLTNGYKQDVKKLINNAIYEEECNDMVIVKNIEFYSMCEHHM
ncbi:MAG: GTP cyclohydrolase I, partial [Victivallales bacterium]